MRSYSKKMRPGREVMLLTPRYYVFSLRGETRPTPAGPLLNSLNILEFNKCIFIFKYLGFFLRIKHFSVLKS
jgi:hypothetical protein